jgi:hypothetical protein
MRHRPVGAARAEVCPCSLFGGVRTFDNAHDPSVHHEHAYVGLEKQSPTVTYGPVNDAMYAAELKLLREWRDIVHGWERMQ